MKDSLRKSFGSLVSKILLNEVTDANDSKNETCFDPAYKLKHHDLDHEATTMTTAMILGLIMN